MFGKSVEGCDVKSYTGLYMSKNINKTVNATNFKGKPEDLAWTVEDSSIVSINDTKGASITIKGEKAGSTHVIVTDNAVGPDCKYSIQVQIS